MAKKNSGKAKVTEPVEPVEEKPAPPAGDIEESVLNKLWAKVKKELPKRTIAHGPKITVHENHIGRIKNLGIIKTDKEIPKSINVLLSGLDPGRHIQFSPKRHGLNGFYLTSSTTPIPVTDKNDICFFMIKAEKNPDLYELI